MNVKSTLLVAAACLLSTALLAHDSKKAKDEMKPAEKKEAASQEGSPEEKAMMEAWMKAATPGAMHKKLEPFVGTFDVKVSSWMKPGDEPMTSAGTSVNSWALDGRWVEQRFEGTFMGMPFKGIGYTGYDNIKGQFIGSWMDNASTALMTTTGTADADGKTFTFTGSMDDPMTKKAAPVTEKIMLKDNDHHTFEMWGPAPDGKMFKMMEISYSRQ